MLCLKPNGLNRMVVFVVRGSNPSPQIPSNHTSMASGIKMHCLRRRNFRGLLVVVVANCIM